METVRRKKFNKNN